VPLALALIWLAARMPRRRRGWASGLCIALAAIALLATLPAFSKIVSWPLRTLVPNWELSGRPFVGAIVVPTGGSFSDSTGRRWPSRETVRRAVLGSELAKETGLPLALSGGSPEELPYSEAVLVADLLGLDRDSLLLDATARNTHENALAFARLLTPLGVRRVVLVTDGIHMVRMAASLRAAGFDVYGHTLGLGLDEPIRAKDFIPSNGGLGYTHAVASGYAGNLYYLAKGRFSVAELFGSDTRHGQDAPGR